MMEFPTQQEYNKSLLKRVTEMAKQISDANKDATEIECACAATVIILGAEIHSLGQAMTGVGLEDAVGKLFDELFVKKDNK